MSNWALEFSIGMVQGSVFSPILFNTYITLTKRNYVLVWDKRSSNSWWCLVIHCHDKPSQRCRGGYYLISGDCEGLDYQKWSEMMITTKRRIGLYSLWINVTWSCWEVLCISLGWRINMLGYIGYSNPDIDLKTIIEGLDGSK